MEIQSKAEVTAQSICVAGICHKTADINIRQIFQVSKKELAQSLAHIYQYDEVLGVVVLTTCNRIEFYMTLTAGTNPVSIFIRFYSEILNVSMEKYERNIYGYCDNAAVNHLFRVISGLESLVFGEYQIQGQIRDAYSAACECKTVDKTLHKLFHAAFRTGKRVRSQTSVGEGKQSVSGLASQIAIDSLTPNSTICIIGVNENSRIFATSMKEAGFKNFVFVNRTIYKAQALANDFGGKAVELDSVINALYESDAVFSSTGAPGYVVGSGMLSLLLEQGYCPKLIIDAAIPRDIDTSTLPSQIEVWDIQRLQNWLETQQEKKLSDLPAAEQIITDEANIFKAWSDTMNNPFLNPYAEKFEQIRQQLIQESRGHFSDNDYENVDRLSKSLVHRLQSTFIRMIIKNQEIK